MSKIGRTTTFLTLPGYEGSGPEHWQSRWEARDPAFRRVEQSDWMIRLEQSLDAVQAPVVLVAHWAAHATAGNLAKVGGALLVGVPDPEGPEFPAPATGFTPVPMQKLPFNTVVVASSDDPYATVDFARGCAEAWGAELVEVGAKGHVNADSGLGIWNEGLELLGFLT